MSFVQPLLLFGLPLIAIPILIHLINRNRHRTIHWAATMFLLKARRMATGMARLRYLLILLARMLAIGGLIFAVSRPMSAGWLGLTAGGAPETTVIVLDRSVSMEDVDPVTRRSKRLTALQKLAQLIQTADTGTQLVLFDSASGRPQPLDSAQHLIDLPETEPTSTATDIPALLQQVTEYILTNETGRTDVWICSDLRQNDWNAEGGRWDAIRSQLADRPGVRFCLLTYADSTADNLAVSVSGIHRRETAEGAELVMDLRLTRSPGTRAAADDTDQAAAADRSALRVPITFVIDGARSTLDVELTGNHLIRNGHVIPIDRGSQSGWGRIDIPGDSNLSDNTFSFVYAEPALQKTVVVSDDPSIAALFRLAAQTPSDHSLRYEAEVFTSEQAAAIPWKETALIIWQAVLPRDLIARQLEDFIVSGRSVMFFPPLRPNETELAGLKWNTWETAPPEQPLTLSRWRTDADLLSNSQSGQPLPAGELNILQFCDSELPKSSELARLENQTALLSRALSDRGAVYFCSTLPTAAHSNLVSNGVVFYVMIQRALARGSGALGAARQYECGRAEAAAAGAWSPLDKLSAEIRPSLRPLLMGLYRDQDTLVALNRPLAEDNPEILNDETLRTLFDGLDYVRINDQSGSTSPLAHEIWRAFLMLMIVALLAEAVLCVPDRPRPATALRNFGARAASEPAPVRSNKNKPSSP